MDDLYGLKFALSVICTYTTNNIFEISSCGKAIFVAEFEKLGIMCWVGTIRTWKTKFVKPGVENWRGERRQRGGKRKWLRFWRFVLWKSRSWSWYGDYSETWKWLQALRAPLLAVMSTSNLWRGILHVSALPRRHLLPKHAPQQWEEAFYEPVQSDKREVSSMSDGAAKEWHLY